MDKMEQSVESYHTVGQSQKELNQQVLHKKNIRYLTGIRDSAHKDHGTGMLTITP